MAEEIQNVRAQYIVPLQSNIVRAQYIAALLLLTYLILAIAHAQIAHFGKTGYQNAPDEAAHFAYVKSLSQGVLLNPENSVNVPNGFGYEWHQPPLAYALAVPFLMFGPIGS